MSILIYPRCNKSNYLSQIFVVVDSILLTTQANSYYRLATHPSDKNNQLTIGKQSKGIRILQRLLCTQLGGLIISSSKVTCTRAVNRRGMREFMDYGSSLVLVKAGIIQSRVLVEFVAVDSNTLVRQCVGHQSWAAVFVWVVAVVRDDSR